MGSFCSSRLRAQWITISRFHLPTLSASIVSQCLTTRALATATLRPGLKVTNRGLTFEPFGSTHMYETVSVSIFGQSLRKALARCLRANGWFGLTFPCPVTIFRGFLNGNSWFNLPTSQDDALVRAGNRPGWVLPFSVSQFLKTPDKKMNRSWTHYRHRADWDH